MPMLAWRSNRTIAFKANIPVAVVRAALAEVRRLAPESQVDIRESHGSATLRVFLPYGYVLQICHEGGFLAIVMANEFLRESYVYLIVEETISNYAAAQHKMRIEPGARIVSLDELSVALATQSKPVYARIAELRVVNAEPAPPPRLASVWLWLRRKGKD